MNILIFSAATGGGHLRTSRAMEAYFTQHIPGAQVEVVDSLKEVHMLVDKTICGSYEFMATKAPRMYGVIYHHTQKPAVDFVPKLSAIFSRRLLRAVDRFQPDVIITTHPFAGEMVSYLKGRGRITVPLIAVMTDYGPHRTYLATHIDAYVVPSKECVRPMMEMGVPEEKIYPFGIPVFSTFFQERDAGALRRELDLNPSLPTVLAMAGSFGVHNIIGFYKRLMELEEDFQLVIITGKNTRLFDALEKIIPDSPKPVKLVYFTTEVEKFMQASDLIITKPGGLTISEALACNLPLAVFDAIPGQEEDNAAFLAQRGMAVRIQKGDDVGEIIGGLLRHPERLQEMKQACQAFDLSRTCEDMAGLMQNMINQPARAAVLGRQRKPRLAK